jgi:hypothetical protein
MASVESHLAQRRHKFTRDRLKMDAENAAEHDE